MLLLSSSVHSKWAAQLERREAIRAAFLHNYGIYEKYAFGYDIVRPITRKGSDNSILAGMGGTIIDSMSTMIIMGLNGTQEYHRALEHVRKTDFTMTRTGNPVGTVSLFELTIRYIGGLISAFELNGEQKQERFLIDQAASLANELTHAWSWNTRIPYNRVNINKKHPEEEEELKDRGTACLAEIGTLTMEWDRLSHYTGNSTYKKLALDSLEAVFDSTAIFPGLWAQRMDRRTEKPHRDYVTWGGGTDSMIEYFSKYPLMLGDSQHKQLSILNETMSSTFDQLVKKTGLGNLTFLADWSKYYGHGTINIHSHLACFSGGNIAMAGKILHKDDWTQLGLEVSESCARMYEMTYTGIGPIAWGWLDKEGRALGWEDSTDITSARMEFHRNNGVFLTMEFYSHQPEVIESMFYAWRITGDEMWRDMAWNAFQSMQKYLEFNQSGWTGITNVNDPSAGLYDGMQSFLFAELFKYLFLMFDDPDKFSLDDYVFNTEAHPFKRKSNSNFGKIQGTFPYTPIYQKPNGDPTTNRKTPQKITFSPSHKTHSSSRITVTPFKITMPKIKTFTAGCDGPKDHSVLQFLACRWYNFLIWPFAFVLGYKVSLCIGRVMRKMELQTYKRQRTINI